MTAIRIGIDALAWKQKTGYGRYCRELISALLVTPGNYSFALLMDSDTPAPAGAEVVRFRSRRNGGDSATRPLTELLRLCWTVARMPVDAWFFPSPLTFVPTFSRAPVMVVIHDTIPWQYPELIFGNRAQFFSWRIKLALAMRRTARVITVSRHARASLARYFALADSAIEVVGEAPSAVFKPNLDPTAIALLADRLELPPVARVIVYHGAFKPHKDLRTLVGAFARLGREPGFDDVHLVLMGSDEMSGNPARHSVVAMCEGLSRVRFPGPLEDGELALLLNRATLAVLPSLDEGFGLSGLEAVASGAPLIATRSSALPEVLGDCAIYFTPGNEDELLAHLIDVLSDGEKRRAMRELGLERVKTLTWTSSARHLLAVFDHVLAQGDR